MYSFAISLALMSAKHPKSSDKSWGGWLTACASDAVTGQWDCVAWPDTWPWQCTCQSSLEAAM